MTHARHLRIVREDHTPKPWVVQYSTPHTQTWTDVHRFTHADDAVDYVNEIETRDRSLEAGR